MCGMATTFGCFARVQSAGGSVSYTSTAAPATWPESRAARRSSSTTMPPRAQFTR